MNIRKALMVLAVAVGLTGNANGADPQTPLHDAAREGNVEAVFALLAGGADPNVKNRVGFTPLHDAAREGNVEAVFALLAGGADPNVKAPNWEPLDWRWTPRDYAIGPHATIYTENATSLLASAALLAAGGELNRYANFYRKLIDSGSSGEHVHGPVRDLDAALAGAKAKLPLAKAKAKLAKAKLAKAKLAKAKLAKAKLAKAKLGEGSLELVIKDGCRDGKNMEYRIFGYPGRRPAGDPIGFAPKEGYVYTAPDNGSPVESKHACRVEDGSIVRSWCYGAARPGHYWGVGLEGKKGCEDCCAECPTSGVSRRSMILVCR